MCKLKIRTAGKRRSRYIKIGFLKSFYVSYFPHINLPLPSPPQGCIQSYLSFSVKTRKECPVLLLPLIQSIFCPSPPKKHQDFYNLVDGPRCWQNRTSNAWLSILLSVVNFILSNLPMNRISPTRVSLQQMDLNQERYSTYLVNCPSIYLFYIGLMTAKKHFCLRSFNSKEPKCTITPTLFFSH